MLYLLQWPWRGAPLLPTRPKGTGLASLSGLASPRNSGRAVLPRECWAPGLSRHQRRERRPCHDIFVAQPLSNPTHMRVKAPKGNHYACRTAGKNGSRATKDVATRQRSHAMAQPAPKAKPAARGAPPSPPAWGEVGPPPRGVGGSRPPRGAGSRPKSRPKSKSN